MDVCRFVPRWGRRYLLRNHQKLALADEARVIIGGFNIEESYFDTPERDGWRDLGLIVEGSAARRLVGYFDALSRWAKQPRASMRSLARLLNSWSEPEGATRWLLGGPMRRLSPWARVVKRDMQRARTIDLITSYFAPNPAMLRRLDKAGKRGRVRLVLPSKVDHTARALGGAFHLCRPAAEEGEDLRISAVQAAHQAVRHRRRGAHRLGEFRHPQHVPQSRADAADRGQDIRGACAALSSKARSPSRNWITAEVYKARTGPWTRVKQFAAYFVMAVLDYNVTRRLNFGPQQPRKRNLGRFAPGDIKARAKISAA